MTRSRKIIRDTIIILFITLLLLIGIEAMLRVVFPRDEFKAEKISYTYDSALLIALRPSIDRIYVRDAVDGGKSVHWKINAGGFRHGPMRKGVRRVMVYGDSNVQGVFSDDQDTYCSRLEAYLSQACGEPAEVVNAGVVGYGPDQSLIKFSRELEIYKPAEAVFVLFAHNDYGDIIRNRLFELDADSNLVMTRHERRMDPLLQKPGLFEQMRILDLVRKVRKKAGMDAPSSPAETRAVTIRQYRDLCSVQFDNYLQGGSNVYSHFFDNYDIDVAAFPDSRSARVKIRLMEEVMKRIAETASRYDIRLCFVILPSAIDVTRNRSISAADLGQFPGYRPDNLAGPMTRTGIALGVPTVDLFSLYSAEDPAGLYFSGEFNDHWTDYGQDLAARLTAGVICPGTR